MVSLPEQSLSLHHTRGAKTGGARDVNVNRAERVASLIGGAVLTLYGARRRDAGGAALALLGGALVHRGATGHCRVYGALGVDTSEETEGFLERKHGHAAILDASRAVRVERTVTVQRAAQDLYDRWRDFERLPDIMTHLERVTVLDEKRSRWRAKAPAGQHVEWEAEIINELPGELIAWKSVADATVPNAGSVHFTPAAGGRGTLIKVVLEYEPPAGALGRRVARMLGEEPDRQVREDLRRFKQVMEAGETPRVEGQPSGRS